MWFNLVCTPINFLKNELAESVLFRMYTVVGNKGVFRVSNGLGGIGIMLFTVSGV